jgi:hypothetical protein
MEPGNNRRENAMDGKPKAKERSDGNKKAESRGAAPGAFRPDFPRKVRENPGAGSAPTQKRKVGFALNLIELSPGHFDPRPGMRTLLP